jgi:hypothetical protein
MAIGSDLDARIAELWQSDLAIPEETFEGLNMGRAVNVVLALINRAVAAEAAVAALTERVAVLEAAAAPAPSPSPSPTPSP